MPHRILLVDDDEKLVHVLGLYLVREQFAVTAAYDGQAALTLARRQPPSLAILDWMLPQVDGLEVCRILRRESQAAVIMLTAKAEEAALVLALQEGADDYLIKPFRPRELVARVHAVLRRVAPPEAGAAYRCGALVVNLAAHEVRRHGRPVPLTPTEFKLLATLMRAPDRVFRREDLVRQVFGAEYAGVDRTIDVHLMNLRKKIEPNPSQPIYIQTVFGVGYKFARSGPDVAG